MVIQQRGASGGGFGFIPRSRKDSNSDSEVVSVR